MKKILVLGAPNKIKQHIIHELVKSMDAHQIYLHDVSAQEVHVAIKNHGCPLVVGCPIFTKTDRLEWLDLSSAYVIWIDNEEEKLGNGEYDIRVRDGGTPEEWARHICHILKFRLD